MQELGRAFSGGENAIVRALISFPQTATSEQSPEVWKGLCHLVTFNSDRFCKVKKSKLGSHSRFTDCKSRWQYSRQTGSGERVSEKKSSWCYKRSKRKRVICHMSFILRSYLKSERPPLLPGSESLLVQRVIIKQVGPKRSVRSHCI